VERIRLLVVICGLIACWANEGLAAMEFEFKADYLSKYIWRGQNAVDDPVFQPSINVSYESLTASIWGNIDLTNINGNSGDFSEVDYSLDHSAALPGVKAVGYSVGFIYYDFPGTATSDTTEVYWGLNLELPLNPSIKVYHDVDEAHGSYVLLAFSHTIEKIVELGPHTPVGMEIGASLGWGSASYNKYYWGTSRSELDDLAFSVGFPFEIKGWTIRPSLNYVTLVSGGIRDTDAYVTGSDFFFAGVGLSKKF